MAALTPVSSFKPSDNPNTPLRLFAGRASAKMAKAVAEYLNIELGSVDIGQHNDGELTIQFKDNIRNSDVFVLLSTCRPVNDNLMELFLMVRTLKRSSARYITAVIPYFGYARQDRKCEPRVPISASDIAHLLESAGVDRVVAVDLHCGQIQGFFYNAPVDNLFSSIVFVPHCAQMDLDNICVISPDAGGVTRAKAFMNGLATKGVESKFAMVIKQRGGAGTIESMNIIGEDQIEGSDCVIVDDIADTCGTLCKAAVALKEVGAKRVFACVCHAVFSPPALERISECDALSGLIVTDTIVHDDLPDKVQVVSVAPLIAETIIRIHEGGSVSELFND